MPDRRSVLTDTPPPSAGTHPEKPALGRNLALPHAQRLVEWLRPVCGRVEIAGSLRREKDVVGDIEIVALPLNQAVPSLFYEGPAPYRPCEKFFILLHRLQASGDLRPDRDKPRDGRLYKRFLLPALAGPGYEQGFGCDLFLAGPDNWGNTLAIRTGSAAFSRCLMSCAWTRRRRRQAGGYLWQCEPGDTYDRPVPAGRARVLCPTERSYFQAIGVPFVEPRFRSEAMIAQLCREGL